MPGQKEFSLLPNEQSPEYFDGILLKSLLKNKHQGVIAINDRGIVCRISESMYPFLYHPSGRLLGKYLNEVCSQPGLIKLLEVLESGAPVFQQNESFDGWPAAVDLLPLVEHSEILGAVALVYFLGRAPAGLDKPKPGQSHKYLKKPGSAKSAACFTADQIIGTSPQMLDLKETIYKVAPRNSTVLITGESGTGKELFAHAVHAASLRRYGPFVRINCAAIPENLLESELFGYEEGAFTGGRKGGQQGKLELAHGGTVFFDEIGELSLPLQAKLLRFLQEREIHKLGSNRPFIVDVRVVAATNVHLEQYVKYKKFRYDLFYRLNVVNLTIPPLRERREDIADLVKHFIEKYNRIFKMKVRGVHQDVLQIFLRNPWLGNIRELENIIERAFNVLEGEFILAKHLPADLAAKRHYQKELGPQLREGEKIRIDEGNTLTDIMDSTEKMVILEALESSGGNKSKAAKLLGITRPCLYKKMMKYRLSTD